MAKNSIEAYNARGKTNLLMFDPERLTLVTDPDHPLYDDRVHHPVSEAMVLNIMFHGVLEPVIVAKNPESGAVEVVDGRQRVKCSVEANKRLAARGEATLSVPAVVRVTKRGESHRLAEVMVSTNEIRTADRPLNRADKMARLAGRGLDEGQIAVIFGCTVATVRSTLAMLDCTADVRNAIEAEKITVTLAGKLAKLPPAEQRAKVAELVAAGDGLKGHAKARQQRAVIDPGAPKMRTRKAIAAERDAATGERRAVLSWVLGEAGGSLNDALVLGGIRDAMESQA